MSAVDTQPGGIELTIRGEIRTVGTVTEYPHLSLDSDGSARIGRTRYKVAHLAAEHYQYGWTAEELLRQHSDLRPEQVYAALTYFYDHYEALVRQLSASANSVEAATAQQAVSREELLRRRASAGL